MQQTGIDSNVPVIFPVNYTSTGLFPRFRPEGGVSDEYSHLVTAANTVDGTGYSLGFEPNRDNCCY